MSNQQLTNNTLQVAAYSLDDFLKEIQSGIKSGFELDFESNENYPQQIGHHYHVILVKKDSVLIQVSQLPVEITIPQEVSDKITQIVVELPVVDTDEQDIDPENPDNQPKTVVSEPKEFKPRGRPKANA